MVTKTLYQDYHNQNFVGHREVTGRQNLPAPAQRPACPPSLVQIRTRESWHTCRCDCAGLAAKKPRPLPFDLGTASVHGHSGGGSGSGRGGRGPRGCGGASKVSGRPLNRRGTQGLRPMNGQGQAPLCRNIQQLGHCRFGAQCRFAQGAAGNTNGDITGPIVTQREWVWTKVRHL